MSRIELKNIKKSFGNAEVIHGINLSIDDGEFCVFVGPSGCGKSTLLRIIAGLEDASNGEVVIDDKVVNNVEPAQRGLAMVFQSYALYPHMNVEQNMSFGLLRTGTSKQETRNRVNEAAKVLKLDEMMKRKPAQLSGGQRQRVAIGRAIVRKPGAFLFDEPLSNLDAELRVDMRIEIAKLHESLGSTMIYVTHDQVEAMTLADKMVVLRDGKIEQFGRPSDIYNDPDNEFVAGFIGSPKMNFLNASVVDGMLEIGQQLCMPIPSGLNLQDNMKVRVGIRPERFDNVFDGDVEVAITISVIENLGSMQVVYGQLTTGEEVIIEQRNVTDLKSGDVLQATISASDLLIFDMDGTRIRPE
ncbi:MAG: sn-glycerol-3-phosphate ABC transporter ATP-binding protein UgpC [Hyphomicrobiales bacterium]